MPWAQQVIDDLAVLREFHNDRLCSLPCPSMHLEPWFDLILSYPSEWKELVSSYFDVGATAENTAVNAMCTETGA
eukprot:8914675-Karenia_brevis.AAC.1